MSSLHPLAAAATLAQSSGVDAHTVTSGRLMGTTAALVAMAGVIIGGLALARSGGHNRNVNGRRGGIVALGAGLTGLAIGGFVVAVADGGPSTETVIETSLGLRAVPRAHVRALHIRDTSGAVPPDL